MDFVQGPSLLFAKYKETETEYASELLKLQSMRMISQSKKVHCES